MRLKNKILAFAITSLLFLFNLAKAVFANDLSADLSSNDLVSGRSMGLGDEDPRNYTVITANAILMLSVLALCFNSLFRIISALIKKFKNKSTKLLLKYNPSPKSLSYLLLFGLLSLPLYIYQLSLKKGNFFHDLIIVCLVTSFTALIFSSNILINRFLIGLLAKKTGKKMSQLPAYYILIDLLITLLIFILFIFITGNLFDFIYFDLNIG